MSMAACVRTTLVLICARFTVDRLGRAGCFETNYLHHSAHSLLTIFRSPSNDIASKPYIYLYNTGIEGVNTARGQIPVSPTPNMQ